MKAITIQNPWGLLVARGIKTTENRGRKTNHRGDIGVHLGKRWSLRGAHDERVVRAMAGHDELVARGASREELDTAMDFARLNLADQGAGWPRGCIMAVAELVDCHPSAGCCLPWGEDRYENAGGTIQSVVYHLVLENVRKLHCAVPAIGQQGVPWTVPEDVAAEVERELAVDGPRPCR